MVGETRLYGGVMGAIFRCAYCDSVVMRLVSVHPSVSGSTCEAPGFYSPGRRRDKVRRAQVIPLAATTPVGRTVPIGLPRPVANALNRNRLFGVELLH